MTDCPRHPEGHVCTQSGQHRDHAAWVAGAMVIWSEPDPPPKPKRMNTVELMAVAKRLEGGDAKVLVRHDDPSTSHRAAKSLRPGSHKALLLAEYMSAPEGLTDEEAASRAGLVRPGVCWWHRASDLRRDGLIADTGTTRPSPTTGEDRMVCVVTDTGRMML